jgi:hypothetical protein
MDTAAKFALGALASHPSLFAAAAKVSSVVYENEELHVDVTPPGVGFDG